MNCLHDFVLANSLQTCQLHSDLKPTSHYLLQPARVGKIAHLSILLGLHYKKNLVCQIILQNSFSAVSMASATTHFRCLAFFTTAHCTILIYNMSFLSPSSVL